MVKKKSPPPQLKYNAQAEAASLRSPTGYVTTAGRRWSAT
jgi:hypothetical protein